MSKAAIGEALASAWLASIPPFRSDLVDRGERYQGNPVFLLEFKTHGCCHTVKVYRYYPPGSTHSCLAFLPDDAVTDYR